MTITEALRRGVRTVNRSKRLWFLFYAVNTLTAGLIAAAAMTVPLHTLGDSAWARQMAANLDLQWIGELAAAHGSLPTLPVLEPPLPPQEVRTSSAAASIVNRQKNWTGLFICAIMQNLEAASTSIAGHSRSALTPSLDLLEPQL